MQIDAIAKSSPSQPEKVGWTHSSLKGNGPTCIARPGAENTGKWNVLESRPLRQLDYLPHGKKCLGQLRVLTLWRPLATPKQAVHPPGFSGRRPRRVGFAEAEAKIGTPLQSFGLKCHARQGPQIIGLLFSLSERARGVSPNIGGHHVETTQIQSLYPLKLSYRNIVNDGHALSGMSNPNPKKRVLSLANGKLKPKGWKCAGSTSLKLGQMIETHVRRSTSLKLTQNSRRAISNVGRDIKNLCRGLGPAWVSCWPRLAHLEGGISENNGGSPQCVLRIPSEYQTHVSSGILFVLKESQGIVWLFGLGGAFSRTCKGLRTKRSYATCLPQDGWRWQTAELRADCIGGPSECSGVPFSHQQTWIGAQTPFEGRLSFRKGLCTSEFVDGRVYNTGKRALQMDNPSTRTSPFCGCTSQEAPYRRPSKSARNFHGLAPFHPLPPSGIYRCVILTPNAQRMGTSCFLPQPSIKDLQRPTWRAGETTVAKRENQKTR